MNPDRPYAVHLAVLDLSDRGIRTIIPLGTSPREGLPERGDEFRPVWSPDGRQLVCRNVEGDLLLVRLDASATTTLARGDLEEPWPVRVSWSPDGSKLALADRGARHQRAAAT